MRENCFGRFSFEIQMVVQLKKHLVDSWAAEKQSISSVENGVDRMWGTDGETDTCPVVVCSRGGAAAAVSPALPYRPTIACRVVLEHWVLVTKRRPAHAQPPLHLATMAAPALDSRRATLVDYIIQYASLDSVRYSLRIQDYFLLGKFCFS